MEAISGYGSDSSDASQGAGASKKQRVALVKRPQVTAAPNLGAVGSAGVTPDYVPGTLTLVKANPTAAELYAPMAVRYAPCGGCALPSTVHSRFAPLAFVVCRAQLVLTGRVASNREAAR